MRFACRSIVDENGMPFPIPALAIRSDEIKLAFIGLSLVAFPGLGIAGRLEFALGFEEEPLDLSLEFSPR